MCEICRQTPCAPGCPNAEPPKPYRCVWCDKMIEADYVHKIGKDWVCEGCEYEYLMDAGAEMYEDFVSENERDFYMNYWFGELLSPIERVAAVKMAYNILLKSKEDDAARKAAYCLQLNDDFPDWVKERLNAGRIHA